MEAGKAYVMVNSMDRRRRMAMSVEDAQQYRKGCREWSRITARRRGQPWRGPPLVVAPR
jgi:hypothetical protein